MGAGSNPLASDEKPKARRNRRHDLGHNADSRIMPMEILVIWFFRPSPRLFDWPLANTTRHNPDILSFRGIR
jgi:hypothetical protein